MDIAIVGTGYVGLVTGACMAQRGHRVTCVDKDEAKIGELKKGKVRIYEPELEELVQNEKWLENLSFSTDIQRDIEYNDVIFICVGTPQGKDGKADLKAVWEVVDDIRMYANCNKKVVIKSTVPVGTNAQVNELLKQQHPQRDHYALGLKHQVISNPEFLREGSAVADCQNPDRIVIGTREPEGVILQSISEFYGTNYSFVIMSPESAELTKYAANGFLAMKISYMNEIANLCEEVGADIEEVKQGISLDDRIGNKFLNAGIGYGGSCFPKDVSALIQQFEDFGVGGDILTMVDEVNHRQKRKLVDKLLDVFEGSMRGKTIAIWGLAFKPGTDDIRDAPSLVTIGQLLDVGANIKVHDPQAMSNFRKVVPPHAAVCCEDKMDAVEAAEALLILTEWDEYRNVDMDLVCSRMKTPIIFDGRNVFDPKTIKGFDYYSIGRKTVYGANLG